MGNKTGIEWTDSTWSPIRVRVKANAAEIARAKGYTSLVSIAEKMAGHVGQHCEHVSPGCEHCYAETNNHRCLPANGTGLPYDRRSRDLVEAFVDEKALLQPLKWKLIYSHTEESDDGEREVDIARPRRIFVENQSDLFAEWVTDEMRDQVFAVMALCPQHTFQVLTKRPERMLAYFCARDVRNRIAREANLLMRSDKRAANSDALAHVFLWDSLTTAEIGEYAYFLSGIADRCWPLPNVWVGTSCENQKYADERIPILCQVPAKVHFISAEPLIGEIDIEYPKSIWPDGPPMCCSGIECGCQGLPIEPPLGYGLKWAIAGGESGNKARPMDPAWMRKIRDQCKAQNIAFFAKQMGSVYGPNKGHELPGDLDIKQFPRAS